MDTAPSARRPVDAIADGYADDVAALDPVGAGLLGLTAHDDRLTDLTPDGFAARADRARAALAAASAAQPVDDRERAAQAAFLERLGLQVERHDAGLVAAQMSVIDSPLHELRMAFDLMDTSTDDGWGSVAARLEAVPETLAGYRRTLVEAADRGELVSRRQYAAVAEQVEGWTGRGTGPGVFGVLVSAAPDHLAATLRGKAEAATAALAETGRFLLAELAPRGHVDDAVGGDRYALESRYFLGARVDLDETYAWGWSELHRIEEEMRSVAAELVPGGGVDEAVALLDADPARTMGSKEAFRDWMQELSDRAVAELADVHFDIPDPIRRLECRLAPTSDGGIYYTGPSEDLTRPGRMWWAVPDGVETFSTWRETTTVFHEGVPGHHLQVAQTVMLRERLNRWQRLLCWVSGSGEGWALYAERLMGELGYLDDPGDRLGMLDAQAFRAARVVVDIGLHCGLPIPRDNPFGFHPGARWTPELMLAFMVDHSRIDLANLRFEVDRYLGWPGQAPSYKVGERLWLQARDDARARHGADFDLKSFHREALALGSIGLDPLAEALGRL